MSESNAAGENLGRTPLHPWHVEHGARMVPFGCYDMPVQYPGGIIAKGPFAHDAFRPGQGHIQYRGHVHVDAGGG